MEGCAAEEPSNEEAARGEGGEISPEVQTGLALARRVGGDGQPGQPAKVGLRSALKGLRTIMSPSIHRTAASQGAPAADGGPSTPPRRASGSDRESASAAAAEFSIGSPSRKSDVSGSGGRNSNNPSRKASVWGGGDKKASFGVLEVRKGA